MPELSNALNQHLVGNRQLVGRKAREALPELVETGLMSHIEEVYRAGRPWVAQECCAPRATR